MLAGSFMRDQRGERCGWRRAAWLLGLSGVLGPTLISADSTIRLQPTARVLPRDHSAQEADNIKTYEAYLKRDQILSDEAAYRKAPYVLAVGPDTLVGVPGQTAVVKGLRTVAVGDEFDFYEGAGSIRGGRRRESFGQVLAWVGRGRVRGTRGDYTDLEILDQTLMGIPVGARVLQLPDPMEHWKPDLRLQDAPRGMTGRVVHVGGGNQQVASLYETVLVSVGTRDGAEAGQLLSVYRQKTDGGHHWPKTKQGRLLIYKPFEKVSYALILELGDEGVNLLDTVASP